MSHMQTKFSFTDGTHGLDPNCSDDARLALVSHVTDGPYLGLDPDCADEALLALILHVIDDTHLRLDPNCTNKDFVLAHGLPVK